MKSIRWLMASILGAGLALGVLWLLGGRTAPVAAIPVLGKAAISEGQPPQAPRDVVTVCPSGACDYHDIQAAVNAADAGDVIKVAAGVYTGVQGRAAPVGYNGAAVITQVVYISKTVTIQGGYTAAFTEPPDPAANHTILDAQGSGRVLFVTGGISPTVEGLRITGGDATGLGGGLEWQRSAGGGVYVYLATAVISSNVIYSNTAYRGAGLWLQGSSAALNANRIVTNTAEWAGGALWLNYSPARISGNDIVSNTASYGGGVVLFNSPATLDANAIISNSASSEGGGLSLSSSDATLIGNIIAANSVQSQGGGLYLENSDATLINNVVIRNRADHQGSGLYLQRSAPHIVHATIARNSGRDGSGIYVTQGWGEFSAVSLTNTIVFSHSVGIMVTAGSTATLNTTLWYANDTDHSGNVIHTGDHSGDPAFVADGYHLATASAAIDQGVDAGVTTDVDGDPRPIGLNPDIGADEARRRVYLPLVVGDF